MSKPNAQTLEAQTNLWAKSVAGADRADLVAIAKAWGSGVITWAHANKLATGLPGKPLPAAIAALRSPASSDDRRHAAIITTMDRPHVGGVDSPAETRDAYGMTAEQRERANAEVYRTMSIGERERIYGGPPSNEISEAQLDAHFERSRAARERRSRRR